MANINHARTNQPTNQPANKPITRLASEPARHHSTQANAPVVDLVQNHKKTFYFFGALRREKASLSPRKSQYLCTRAGLGLGSVLTAARNTTVQPGRR